MTEPLDQADREICAALLRNGRASWRLISKVTGIQERTVARRGARLLEQGIVRVRGLSQPHLVNRGEGYFARIRCAPSNLHSVAKWLSHRKETLWVATLESDSAIIAECYLRYADRNRFIGRELSEQPITDYSFSYVEQYRRTVRGWHPNILNAEQLEMLGEDETRALEAAARARQGGELNPDQIDTEVVRLLGQDGRLSIDAIATAVGVGKVTVRKRIAQMQQTDYLSIRAVIDPALLGFPLESLITIHAPSPRIDEIASRLSADWRTRWAAELPTEARVQALMTLESRFELFDVMRDLDQKLGGIATRIEASPVLTHYKRSDVVLPAAL
ncbi:Lrp/AsnC family transcriptional regulator [Arthrobacter sp. NPDC090010]|uniref:Lrp/AsnC family transcriptional regulator n=1 Tax=Arthrobacter sp. NPDC090010 TaxID=3363942 RepID=UPI003805F53B